MKKTWKLMLLLAVSSTLLLSGCRRKPVATETETETETQTETETETETEKITEKQTERKTAASSTKKPSTSQTEKKTSVQPNETNTNKNNTSANSSATQTCPYCYQSFSTTPDSDGSSEYSRHYAQEKAYADMYGIQPDDTSSDSTSSDSSSSSGSSDSYAQCPYCYQWFSTTPDASGYSPYGEHEAA